MVLLPLNVYSNEVIVLSDKDEIYQNKEYQKTGISYVICVLITNNIIKQLEKVLLWMI